MRDDRDAYSRRKYKYRINEAYVKYKAVKLLKLPLKYSVFILRPLIVGCIPSFLYKKLHSKKIQGGINIENFKKENINYLSCIRDRWS